MAEAYEKGRAVFQRGIMDRRARYKNLVPNPFKSKTSSYREWERGFNAAYFEQRERVHSDEQKVRKEASKRSRAVLQEQSKNKKK